MLRIHHLNCGTMCPWGGQLIDGVTRGLGSSHLVCHCLLIESDQGLILVDTGLGTRDVLAPEERLSPLFRKLLRIELDLRDTALKQLDELGFDPADVRHIILTHLDFDHAGGIEDFPRAKVHLHHFELEAAQKPRSFLDRHRYRAEQWDDDIDWTTYGTTGESWFGFRCVRDLKGLPPEILLIPLFGHTRGHSGVAIQHEDGWLLHAGDAYFYRNEMRPDQPSCTPGLKLYQKMMSVDRRQRESNQDRLRTLVKLHGDQVQVMSAHDAVEFSLLQDHGLFPGREHGSGLRNVESGERLENSK